MINLALCIILLTRVDGRAERLRIQGDLVADYQEVWIVDFEKFITTHPLYKGNSFVQLVNNNDCLYDGKRNARFQK